MPPTSCAIRPICPARSASARPRSVKVDLETVELVGKLDDGTTYTYWTFNAKVPGPFVRVRVGDTVEVHLKNPADSVMAHSVDFHAATGPGGGAHATQTDPGNETIVTFKALKPGIYVYHCATPSVAHHITNGMYGLILVEPEGGLPQVDREFYVMQGELYTVEPFGTQGEMEMDYDKLISERPEYFLFNGAVGSLTKTHPLYANVGETVRIYLRRRRPELHLVLPCDRRDLRQRLFDGQHLSPPIQGVQTVTVPPGGATIVDFKIDRGGNLCAGRSRPVARRARPCRLSDRRRSRRTTTSCTRVRRRPSEKST